MKCLSVSKNTGVLQTRPVLPDRLRHLWTSAIFSFHQTHLKSEGSAPGQRARPWIVLFRPAVGSCHLPCCCVEVAEARPPCPVCPSRPPASSAGRSSSWARAEAGRWGLRCRRSSALHAPTAHGPTGGTKCCWLWLKNKTKKTQHPESCLNKKK